MMIPDFPSPSLSDDDDIECTLIRPPPKKRKIIDLTAEPGSKYNAIQIDSDDDDEGKQQLSSNISSSDSSSASSSISQEDDICAESIDKAEVERLVKCLKSNKDLYFLNLNYQERLLNLCLSLIEWLKKKREDQHCELLNILIITSKRNSTVMIYKFMKKIITILTHRFIGVSLATGGRLIRNRIVTPVHVQVATPGKLIGELNRGAISLKTIDCIVFEGANDLLTSECLRKQMIQITSEKNMPPRRITTIWTDTIPFNGELENDMMKVHHRGKEIETLKMKSHYIIEIKDKIIEDKIQNLMKIIKYLYRKNGEENLKKIICFFGYKNEMRTVFNTGFKEEEGSTGRRIYKYVIDGSKSIDEREYIIKEWKKKKERHSVHLLFSSDLLAGSAFGDADVVINFSFARDWASIKTYVDRASCGKKYCIIINFVEQREERGRISNARCVINDMKNVYGIKMSKCDWIHCHRKRKRYLF